MIKNTYPEVFFQVSLFSKFRYKNKPKSKRWRESTTDKKPPSGKTYLSLVSPPWSKSTQKIMRGKNKFFFSFTIVLSADAQKTSPNRVLLSFLSVWPNPSFGNFFAPPLATFLSLLWQLFCPSFIQTFFNVDVDRWTIAT